MKRQGKVRLAKKSQTARISQNEKKSQTSRKYLLGGKSYYEVSQNVMRIQSGDDKSDWYERSDWMKVRLQGKVRLRGKVKMARKSQTGDEKSDWG